MSLVNAVPPSSCPDFLPQGLTGSSQGLNNPSALTRSSTTLLQKLSLLQANALPVFVCPDPPQPATPTAGWPGMEYTGAWESVSTNC